jgi:DNA-binding transcriptional MerR regulator
MVGIRLRPVDVAREFGRSVAWLKRLEKAGVIPPAARDALNGQRVYTEQDVAEIRRLIIGRRRQAPGATAVL